MSQPRKLLPLLALRLKFDSDNRPPNLVRQTERRIRVVEVLERQRIVEHKGLRGLQRAGAEGDHEHHRKQHLQKCFTGHTMQRNETRDNHQGMGEMVWNLQGSTQCPQLSLCTPM